MSNKYWENEAPETIQTERNIIRYFRQAGKLQIAVAYKDGNGELKQGKTATLDAEDMAVSPECLGLLRQFIDDCKSA